MSRVVVAGAVANKPGSAGEAWVRMSWVRGLERLGHDVRFAEELGGDEVDPVAVDWFRDVVASFGLSDRATLLHRGEAVAGPSVAELAGLAADATLVNISGHLRAEALPARFGRRVMVDIDPGFTQFWNRAGLSDANVRGHDLHFTIGELIGAPECSIPSDGIEWLKVRPPVVLEDWPVEVTPDRDRFTTVASWRGGFGPIEYEGRTFGLKVHEFRKYAGLPRAAHRGRFEIALDIHDADRADRDMMSGNGWQIVLPAEVVGDTDAFRRYVHGSGAEFSVAQGIYVETNSGWFSDRTTRYLASGKPALVQDTGFSRILPTGEGLVAFRNLEEAAAGAEDIVSRYPEHCAAARAIAERHFGSDAVLTRFCEQAGIG